jgi:homoserine O-acetyltransferase
MNRTPIVALAMTALLAAMLVTPAAAATPQVGELQPKPNDAFVDVHDFVFDDGERLASLKLHYLTLGTPRRDASGAIVNGVLLLHGTAGSAADLVQANFFDALYGAGEPLDLSRYFLVIPDAIGAGESSKPSDGLQAHFPHTATRIRFAPSIYFLRR